MTCHPIQPGIDDLMVERILPNKIRGPFSIYSHSEIEDCIPLAREMLVAWNLVDMVGFPVGNPFAE